jgi:prepilin-type N-terminal cleavage/methylation domain-containing protein
MGMKNLAKQDGFSLVEVLIAVTILLLMVVTFTVLFTSTFDHIITSGRKSEALYLSQQKVDAAVTPDSTSVVELEISFTGLNPIFVEGHHNIYSQEYKTGRYVFVDLFIPD